jgi:hypothetical protein
MYIDYLEKKVAIVQAAEVMVMVMVLVTVSGGHVYLGIE